MKTLLFIALLSTAAYQAQAQSGNLNQDVDHELDQLYSAQGQANVNQAGAIPSQVVQPSTTASTVQNTPIYIVSPSNAGAAQVQNSIQKQPTTLVQASPLSESRADQMRRARQETELQTETKIVEKLEQSRIEDEKRRAQILFGDKLEQSQASQQQVQQQAVQQVPVVVAPAAQNVPVEVVKEPKENTRDIIREELQAALKAEEAAPETAVEQRYFSASVGIAEVEKASNVRGNYSLGAAFGTMFDGTYAVEGSFTYTNSTMNPVVRGMIYNGGYSYYAPDMEVSAYSGAIALKYFFFDGMVKPVVGGLAQYTYRTYSYDTNSNGGSDTTNSHAVDLGAIVGADIQFSKKFAIGLDYKYLFNVSSRRGDSAVVYNQPYYGTALETLNSYIMSVNAKVLF
jgi:hypothetical protein